MAKKKKSNWFSPLASLIKRPISWIAGKKQQTHAEHPQDKKPPIVSDPSLIDIKSKSLLSQRVNPVPDKTVLLNIPASHCDHENHDSVKGSKSPLIYGRAQIYDGTYNQESDIVIGFDFGTSSSKLVFRDSARQTAYAVPFGALSCEGNSYLIPTNIFVSADGKLSLSTGGHSYNNIKSHLINNYGQHIFTISNYSYAITAKELATAYMALVIRFARAWFLQHNEAIYRKTHIHWHINMGIPSKNYGDKSMVKTFRSIEMAAWRLSRYDTAITITELKKIFVEAEGHIETNGSNIDTTNDDSLWRHPEYVHTHPEVIMEVVGYVRSPLRTKGLHLLIDVGASTLDVATFIVHSKDGEDYYPLLATDVKSFGTMELHKRRIESLKNCLRQIIPYNPSSMDRLQQISDINPTSPLPDLSHYEMSLGTNELSKIDVIFFKECYAIVGEVIRNTLHHRDPHSNAWETGLPVFICGGGGRLSGYRKTIENLGYKISISRKNFKGFSIKNIPKPDQLDAPDLSRQEYDRLAVAYGLSFTSDEIGEVVRESQVSDVHKKDRTRNIDDIFVSKDMC